MSPTRRRLAATCVGVLCTWLTLLPIAAAGAEGEVSGFDAMRLGISVGYSGGSDERVVSLLPRWRIAATRPLFDDVRALRGRLDATLEGNFLLDTRSKGGFAYGVNLLAGYEFLGCRGLVPRLFGGLGILDLDFDAARQSDGLNFSIHGGLGVGIPLGERFELGLDYRYQHISNADLRSPNRGFDLHGAFIGVSAALR